MTGEHTKTGGREAILSSIRGALNVVEGDADRRALVNERLTNHEPNTIPLRATGSHADLVERFCSALKGQSADILVADNPSFIPKMVEEYIRAQQLPLTLKMGDESRFKSLAWEDETSLAVTCGATRGQDLTTLSYAFGAAAETGTLFLTAGPENPTSLNFLADTHIVVIDEDKIAGSFEDVWRDIRETYKGQKLPRAINLIGGPSRTADIEQTIVMGAHGPRQLAVIIVKNA